jgi:uridine kinase
MKTLCIGVAGGTGSGKTTVVAHLDDHHRTHHNFDHPNAIEEGLLHHHLELLKAGEPAPLPVYDFARHVRLTATEWVEARPVILLEGILVLAIPSLRDLLDIKLFVDTDADLRFIRRLRRDMAERGRSVDSVVDQYMATVRPMHLEFVESSKRWADVIIPEGGFNTVALDLVISRILQMLRSEG